MTLAGSKPFCFECDIMFDSFYELGRHFVEKHSTSQIVKIMKEVLKID